MDCSENAGGRPVPSKNTSGLSYRQKKLPLASVLSSTRSDLVIPPTFTASVAPVSEKLVTPPTEESHTEVSPTEDLETPTTKLEVPPTKAAPTTNSMTLVALPTSKKVTLPTLKTQKVPTTSSMAATPIIVAVIPAINPKGVSPPTKPLAKKEREEQKAERERVKAERERVKAEMKAMREEERLRKEHEKQLREQEKRERQLKREQQLKERQEKREREELEKKERKEKRDAEKRKKDEEKQKKLEERRKLEQEKEQQKEEKARREKEAKLKFLGFFGKVEKPTVKKEEVPGENILTPFSIKDSMSLAGAPREPLQDTSEFDRLVLAQNLDFTSDFLHTCKSLSRKVTPMEMEVMAAAASENDSVVVVSDPPKQKLPKFKLLQFQENHRPAYYGSWRRARGAITPRNPLRKDEGILDYQVDSDDEWEEEEPGESLSSSEGEEKEVEAEGEDSDEEDDGFFVPHGYLSNDEGDCSDSEQLIPGPGEDRSDTKKSKQLAKAWEAEFARKCQPLKPKAIGCIWLPVQLPPNGEDGSGPDLTRDESFLLQFAAVPLVSLPISTTPVATIGETSAQKVEGQGAAGNAETMKQSVPEEAMPDLIRFIHKSTFGVGRILKMFRTHWGAKISKNSLSQFPSQTNTTSHPLPPDKIDSTPINARINSALQNTNQHKIDSTPKTTSQHEIESTPTSTDYTGGEDYENASKISKRQLEKKIQAIAVKEIRPPITKAVWYVHDAVLKQYGLETENFAPLVPNGSPFLSEKSVEQALVTPETPNQQKVSKRKSGYVGKSLLHFLSKSPADKAHIFSPPKRMKLDPPLSVGKSLRDFLSRPPANEAQTPSHPKPDLSPANNDVIILDPPDVSCKGPPTKRSCLNPPSDHENEMSTANTNMLESQDVIILDFPDSTNEKASPMTISDDLSNGGVACDTTSSNQGIQCS